MGCKKHLLPQFVHSGWNIHQCTYIFVSLPKHNVANLPHLTNFCVATMCYLKKFLAVMLLFTYTLGCQL